MKHHLDARRLLCPLPVIRVQDKVAQLQPGDLLEVTATDPGVLSDVPAWARLNGHRILHTERRGREVIIELEVGDE